MSKVDELREEIRRIQSGYQCSHSILPFGIPEIDAHLPNGGLAMGAYHEVASSGESARHSAAATLFAAGIMARTGGQVLWCMKYADLFAPALAHVGLTMDRVTFVEAGDEKTVLACFEEGLRHNGLTGVVAEINKLSMINARRLQLAAESSGVMGITIRRWWKPKDEESYAQPTAARSRWRITCLPSAPLPVAGIGRARWRLELMRCQLGKQSEFEVEACDEKGHIRISTDLVDRSIAPSIGQFGAVC